MNVSNSEKRLFCEVANAKGSVLLIHGTAAQNLDGVNPRLLVETGSERAYQAAPTFANLSKRLNALGWNTLRYTRPGVSAGAVDPEIYKTTDLPTILIQLQELWDSLPMNLPRVAFAWSGGSVHLLQLNLEGAAAAIILGGIARSRFALALKAMPPEKRPHLEREIANFVWGEPPPPDEMTGDGPLRRFWDEARLNENWTYLLGRSTLPLLILHGDTDVEVDVSEAFVWQEVLPSHPITTVVRRGGDHAFSLPGEPPMEAVADAMNEWLEKVSSR